MSRLLRVSTSRGSVALAPSVGAAVYREGVIETDGAFPPAAVQYRGGYAGLDRSVGPKLINVATIPPSVSSLEIGSTSLAWRPSLRGMLWSAYARRERGPSSKTTLPLPCWRSQCVQIVSLHGRCRGYGAAC